VIQIVLVMQMVLVIPVDLVVLSDSRTYRYRYICKGWYKNANGSERKQAEAR